MPDPNAASVQLAQRLKGLRIAADLSGVELEAKSGIGRQKISRTENNRRLLTAGEVRRWVAACDGGDREAEALVELLATALQSDSAFDVEMASGGQDKIQEAYAALAASATEIAYMDPYLVPGPLQTVEYAREILTRSENFWRKGGANPDTVERAVAARRSIAFHFTDTTKQFTFVTSEVAINTFHYLRPPEMLLQLQRLDEVAAMPQIWFGVIPPGYVPDTIIPHGFQRFDDQIRADTAGEIIRRSNKTKFDPYMRRLEAVKELAVTGGDAQALIRAAAKQLGS